MSKEMTPNELYQSVQFGKRVAEQCIMRQVSGRQPLPLYGSALRHMLAERGEDAAIALAQRICGMSGAEASEHIAKLQRTRSVDIVSPHWE